MRVFSNRWVQAGIAATLIIAAANLLKAYVTIHEPSREEMTARAAADYCRHDAPGVSARARDAVRSELMSPRSASFSSSRVVHVGDCKLEASGHVDAQNTFGAEIRSTYIVTLQYDPERDHWTTLNVVIQ